MVNAQTALGLTAKAAVSALVVGVVISHVDLAGVRASVAAASAPKLLVAFTPFLLAMALGGLRWWITLRGIGERASPVRIAVLFSAAAVIGQVLPSVAADGTRVWLATRIGHGLRASAQSVLLERLFMVLAVLALALGTAPMLAAQTGYRPPVWLTAALLAGGVAGLGATSIVDRARPWLTGMPLWQVLAETVRATRRLLTSRWGLALATTSLVSNFNFALSAFLLGRALGIDLTLRDLAVVMPVVTLATTLPISLGGWGVREGVMVLLLGPLGVPAAAALSLSLLFGVFGMISGLPGLTVLVFGWSKDKHGLNPRLLAWKLRPSPRSPHCGPAAAR